MQVYVPELEIAEPGDKLDAHVLSQEVVVMRDGAWVFLYNEVHRSSPLKAESIMRMARIRDNEKRQHNSNFKS